jgi:hypothetical protein
VINRRTLFKWLLGGLGAAAAAPIAVAEKRRVLIQESPVAGFQFHDGEYVWPSLHVGQAVKLVREPFNSHDPQAVAIYSGEAQLGYVPRVENHAVAEMMDRGERLEASIVELSDDDNPWNRIHVGISLVRA